MINWIQKKRNKKGFTLIELIVVIAILGILAAIAIPRLGGFTQQAKVKADLATYNTIDKSIAIGVADGSLKGATPATTVGWNLETGEFSGDASATAKTTAEEMAKLVEGTPKLELTESGTITWSIAIDGEISADYYIDETSGALTAVGSGE